MRKILKKLLQKLKRKPVFDEPVKIGDDLYAFFLRSVSGNYVLRVERGLTGVSVIACDTETLSEERLRELVDWKKDEIIRLANKYLRREISDFEEEWYVNGKTGIEMQYRNK